jgi:hypothetical protein
VVCIRFRVRDRRKAQYRGASCWFLSTWCCAQGGKQLGADEAAAWSRNAWAWVEATCLRFPDYRDLLQPVSLAILEVRAVAVCLLKRTVLPEDGRSCRARSHGIRACGS